MKSKLSFEMALYRRYKEPFALRVQSSHMGFARGSEAGSTSLQGTENLNEQATLTTVGHSSSVSRLHEEPRWTTQ
jgi:hypothetical protein